MPMSSGSVPLGYLQGRVQPNPAVSPVQSLGAQLLRWGLNLSSGMHLTSTTLHLEAPGNSEVFMFSKGNTVTSLNVLYHFQWGPRQRIIKHIHISAATSMHIHAKWNKQNNS